MGALLSIESVMAHNSILKIVILYRCVRGHLKMGSWIAIVGIFMRMTKGLLMLDFSKMGRPMENINNFCSMVHALKRELARIMNKLRSVKFGIILHEQSPKLLAEAQILIRIPKMDDQEPHLLLENEISQIKCEVIAISLYIQLCIYYF